MSKKSNGRKKRDALRTLQQVDPQLMRMAEMEAPTAEQVKAMNPQTPAARGPVRISSLNGNVLETDMVDAFTEEPIEHVIQAAIMFQRSGPDGEDAKWQIHLSRFVPDIGAVVHELADAKLGGAIKFATD